MRKLCLLFFVIGMIAAGSSAVAQEWNEHKSRHFIVYYKDAPEDFVGTVAKSAERYFKEISSNLGFNRYRYWNAEDLVEVYIYDDAEDFVDNARQANWSAGVTHARSRVIKTFPTAHGFFDSTLPHELGHIIFREFVGYDARVPLWFEEGVAMYQEKAKRWGSHRLVREAMEKGTFIPMDKLNIFRPNRRTERKKVELFYAQAASIVYYLIQEQGRHRFVRLCRKIQDDILFEEAIKSVYPRFRDLDELEETWQDYLKR